MAISTEQEIHRNHITHTCIIATFASQLYLLGNKNESIELAVLPDMLYEMGIHVILLIK